MTRDEKVKKLTEYYGGDELAASVLVDKYLREDETCPEDMWRRLAYEISKQEKTAGDWVGKFNNLLKDFKFIPGGRIMYGVGRGEKVSTTNCYVIPIKEDSIEGIYEWLRESALTYRSTGGVGVDISVLRPAGTPVKNSGGESPGACSFMDLMSRSTHTVHQKLRRGALMITMNVHHPDIMEFIKIKQQPGMVEHANISVQITDEFMKALIDGEKYEQRWPIDSEPRIKKEVDPKKVWNEIIKSAHKSAEPGIMFIDNHRRNDALAYCNPTITTNPCGEQFLGAYGNCNLGHMNLSKYVIEDVGPGEVPYFDYDNFVKDIAVAVRFLDNVIDHNKGNHALPEQEEAALGERRIGLGITGLGDCLIKLGDKYGSAESLIFLEEIMKCFRDSAYEASIELAEEKGAFPLFENGPWESSSRFVCNWIDDKFMAYPGHMKQEMDEETKLVERLRKTGIRNSFLLTCAPVGSGSIIAQVSSGIEPLFATSYSRRVRQQDGKTFKEYKTYPKVIEERFQDDKNLPDYVVTAHDIDPADRVVIQGLIQKYIDNSISSTVNLPKTVHMDAIGSIYMDAYLKGLKGITVYVEGSREGILKTEEPKEEKPKKKTKEEPCKRPISLEGKTYKIPCGPDQKLYITVNPFKEDPKRPYEVFIGSFGKNSPEIQTITVLLSALLKNVEDPTFIIDHLRRIESSAQPVWWHDVDAGRRHTINSVARAVSIALEKFVNEASGNGKAKDEKLNGHLNECPKCNRNAWVNENGCGHCIECGHSKCD